jgi:hypothetical protein
MSISFPPLLLLVLRRNGSLYSIPVFSEYSWIYRVPVRFLVRRGIIIDKRNRCGVFLEYEKALSIILLLVSVSCSQVWENPVIESFALVRNSSSENSSFDIVFSPATAGAKTAALNVPYGHFDSPCLQITLTGTGMSAIGPDYALTLSVLRGRHGLMFILVEMIICAPVGNG